MNVKLTTLMLAVALVLGVSSLHAQDKGKAKVRSITGCLSQGDSDKEFKLTATNGSTWEVKSDAVNLAEHVGHTITAKGTVSNVTMHNLKEDTKDAAADTGMKKNNTEHGHLTVTSVKMVSDSCK